MKKVLVTGGMGFVGNHLVKKLLNENIEVTVIDKSIFRPTYHDISKAHIIEGDLLSKELVLNCLNTVDTCFHLAALSSIAMCNRDWIFSHQNNVMTFNNILEAIRQIKKPIKLIYASSSAVYGNSTVLPLIESLALQPSSTYGVDKLANELYASIMNNIYQIPSIGLRLFNIYGPGQAMDNPYSGVITLFKKALLEKRPLSIYGDGLQTRDFIYIEDVVNAFILAAQTPYPQIGIYNICRGEAISIKDLGCLLMDIMEQPTIIKYEDKRPGDLMHSLGSPDLAQKELAFKAETKIEEGIKRLLIS